MRLSAEGEGSPEPPLRVLNLLAQQGAVLNCAALDLGDSGYQMLLEITVGAARGALILDKIRAMVLVRAAEVLA